jgi:hypothetical protein
MKIRNNFVKIISIFIILLFLLSSIIVFGDEINHKKNNTLKIKNTNIINNTTYEGILRIYIAEPVSRWNMYDNEPYHYGFLDFAYNNEIYIEYEDTFEDTIIWEGDVELNNVIVIASVFNSKRYTGFAYPPSRNEFSAHLVDATAGAMPGFTGYNQIKNNFTHTVFIEEGSATWCHNCPDMANKLNQIYESNNYPFYFISYISDMNEIANSRLQNDYNVFGYPSAFFDGGKNVILGSGVSLNDYISTIESCGERNVHDLNMSLSVLWLGDGNLEISISIKNNEIVENVPPETPIIQGPAKAKIGENIEYKIKSNDPEGEDIYYLIEWGDNNIEEWFGPYESGSELIVDHIWNNTGNYLIKVKAKDINNHESDWGTIEVKTTLIYQNIKILLLLDKIFEEIKIY